MLSKYITAIFALLAIFSFSAKAKKVKALFIGNSYTYVNDLPQLTAALANSLGDTLIYETQAQGGFTLGAHTTTTATLDAIKKGGWNYVILQEQSQLPALQEMYVQQSMYPYARKLDSLIHIYSPCANTIFYMTWGRKNGDAGTCVNWPPVCTYEGMDSMLRLRYMIMAVNYNASVSPVGPVWHYIRTNHPGIELYDADESHPSPAGSYAAACAFYTAIFKRSPATSTYNFSLNATDAANIRTAAKIVAYDSMATWQMNKYELFADFDAFSTGTQATFNNNSKNATSYYWDFGDGQTSTQAVPTHFYPVLGTYKIMLIANSTSPACSDTLYKDLNLFPDGIHDINNVQFVLSPNPVTDVLNISSSLFLSKTCRINVINTLGQTVYELQTGRDEKQELSLSGLGSQLYIVTISNEGRELYRQKFIKN